MYRVNHTSNIIPIFERFISTFSRQLFKLGKLPNHFITCSFNNILFSTIIYFYYVIKNERHRPSNYFSKRCATYKRIFPYELSVNQIQIHNTSYIFSLMLHKLKRKFIIGHSLL